MFYCCSNNINFPFGGSIKFHSIPFYSKCGQCMEILLILMRRQSSRVFLCMHLSTLRRSQIAEIPSLRPCCSSWKAAAWQSWAGWDSTHLSVSSSETGSYGKARQDRGDWKQSLVPVWLQRQRRHHLSDRSFESGSSDDLLNFFFFFSPSPDKFLTGCLPRWRF